MRAEVSTFEYEVSKITTVCVISITCDTMQPHKGQVKRLKVYVERVTPTQIRLNLAKKLW